LGETTAVQAETAAAVGHDAEGRNEWGRATEADAAAAATYIAIRSRVSERAPPAACRPPRSGSLGIQGPNPSVWAKARLGK
jgi:hypothetical protein